MIRQATKYDKDQIIQMMLEFKKESKIEVISDINNLTYWNKLLDNIILGQGVIFIEDNVGLLMSVIAPYIWCDKTLCLHEIAWYVRPEHRYKSVGHKLLKKYINYGNELKSLGRIKLFTISKLYNSPNIDYSKFGFTLIDENWMA
jgi:N-acetylglutamate synthase-like GNAT family acetyltransferase